MLLRTKVTQLEKEVRELRVEIYNLKKALFIPSAEYDRERFIIERRTFEQGETYPDYYYKKVPVGVALKALISALSFELRIKKAAEEEVVIKKIKKV